MEDKKVLYMGVCVKRLFVLAVLVVLLVTGCNRQVVDLNYKFDRAIIKLPDGEVVSGAVESWRDYEDGDQIQIKIDGTLYLVHSMNCVLIQETRQ